MPTSTSRACGRKVPDRSSTPAAAQGWHVPLSHVFVQHSGGTMHGAPTCLHCGLSAHGPLAQYREQHCAPKVHACALITQLPSHIPLMHDCEQQVALVWHACPSVPHAGWHSFWQNCEQHCAAAVQICPSGLHWGPCPQIP